MALSTADTNKWSTLLEKRHWTSELKATALEYERTGPILQRQRRLTETQAIAMAARYEEGATVYELAADFGCNRTTVAARLKKAGITMRLQSPGSELIDSMVGLYESGLSLAAVGSQVGKSAGTVHNYLRLRNIEIRNCHGQIR